MRIHLEVYNDFLVNVMAVPSYLGLKTARERFAWEGVAGGVLAAAQGRLAELPPVA